MPRWLLVLTADERGFNCRKRTPRAQTQTTPLRSTDRKQPGVEPRNTPASGTHTAGQSQHRLGNPQDEVNTPLCGVVAGPRVQPWILKLYSLLWLWCSCSAAAASSSADEDAERTRYNSRQASRCNYRTARRASRLATHRSESAPCACRTGARPSGRFNFRIPTAFKFFTRMGLWAVKRRERRAPAATSPAFLLPLRLERGESDATLAHRIPFSASDGEKVAKPDEVFPGSGEGLGVRVSGEVSKSFSPFASVIFPFIPQSPRRNQPRAPAVVPFHPARAGASGHKAPTIAHRSDTTLRRRVRPPRRDATPRLRTVSTRAASRCRHLRDRRDASRETNTRGLTTPGRIDGATILQVSAINPALGQNIAHLHQQLRRQDGRERQQRILPP